MTKEISENRKELINTLNEYKATEPTDVLMNKYMVIIKTCKENKISFIDFCDIVRMMTCDHYITDNDICLHCKYPHC